MAQVSPLRRRMIEDMTVRNLSPATQRSYLAAVAKLSRYFGRSPDCLELEDIRAFQVDGGKPVGASRRFRRAQPAIRFGTWMISNEEAAIPAPPLIAFAPAKASLGCALS